jgi:hypothetical protein
MPTGLDIDYKRRLNGTIAPYSDHLLIHTGSHDWPSRIEDDARHPLARKIKASLKAETIKSLPKRPANILVTNSSFATTNSDKPASQVVSLMKAGLHFRIDGTQEPQVLNSLMKVVADDAVTKETLRQSFGSWNISDIVILICGHEARDSRCGIMGPLLQVEFESKLQQAGIKVLRNAISPDTDATESMTARVGLISHIGGHAFAGNCIIYIPTTPQYKHHPLSGLGVWYGRVQPRHIQGIVQKTVGEGTVIEELLRGIV